MPPSSRFVSSTLRKLAMTTLYRSDDISNTIRVLCKIAQAVVCFYSFMHCILFVLKILLNKKYFSKATFPHFILLYGCNSFILPATVTKQHLSRDCIVELLIVGKSKWKELDGASQTITYPN